MITNKQQNPDWIGEREEEFFKALATLSSSSDVQMFVTDLFTPEEIKNAAKRWCVVCSLYDGNTQALTLTKCESSKATVARARRNILKNGSGITKTVYELLKS